MGVNILFTLGGISAPWPYVIHRKRVLARRGGRRRRCTCCRHARSQQAETHARGGASHRARSPGGEGSERSIVRARSDSPETRSQRWGPGGASHRARSPREKNGSEHRIVRARSRTDRNGSESRSASNVHTLRSVSEKKCQCAHTSSPPQNTDTRACVPPQNTPRVTRPSMPRVTQSKHCPLPHA